MCHCRWFWSCVVVMAWPTCRASRTTWIKSMNWVPIISRWVSEKYMNFQKTASSLNLFFFLYNVWQACNDILKASYTSFANLVQKLLSVPFEKEFFYQVSVFVRFNTSHQSQLNSNNSLISNLSLFLQEVFPATYGSSYDQELQQLMSDFLSRLEQLLPVPDLQQVRKQYATIKQILLHMYLFVT